MSEQLLEIQQVGNGKARRLALEAVSRFAPEPTGLVQYRSQGDLLIIGGEEAVAVALGIKGSLHPRILLTEPVSKTVATATSLAGRTLSIEGSLGGFKIQLGVEEEPDAELLKSDLILDLTPLPLLGQSMPPVGYLHCRLEESEVSAAIETLSGLVGIFEKPTYIDYAPAKCAHGRSGLTACTRCIDACPARAITSQGESVVVDPNLCQGGGICASACPSGAIRYTYPSARDTLARIRLMLNEYREQGGSEPVVVFYSESEGEITQFLQDNYLPVMLEELASVGFEVWLSALAYGARGLLLLDRGGMPPEVRKTLELQLQCTREILTAMGYRKEAITLIDSEPPGDERPLPMPMIEAAGFMALQDKRESAFMAIDHLYSQSPRPKPLALLSTGAPFGTAQVDENRCTLCMACVGACPGNALQHGHDHPQLSFIEANCLQCGMCTRTCPENAIWITPRFLFDRKARTRQKLLHKERPFNCTVCGKPFATQSVINSMQSKLLGHWMFQDDRSRRRLTMCEECRVVDAIKDPVAMENGQLGLNRQ
ncbi:MAG: hypothetical protein GY934_22645 [Gammaproteobacteria bacterium]|nr:hypothetical protein [Gammaproteobacteria bacterium]